MYNIIKRYCESDDANGLLLLDMPTGAGKTYSVIKYIFDAVQDKAIKRKFFFITTLKKNLPEDDLKRHFEDAGQLAQFQELFLRLDSNYESVLAGLTTGTIKAIPGEIKSTDEYKALEQQVHYINALRKDGKYSSGFMLQQAEDVLRQEIEPKFRKMLKAILAKQYFTLNDKLWAIKTEKQWQWVAKLYPSVFMRERQIIFMSVDKFLSPNDTIVEPSILLYHSELIDNAVVFIDEFDATKTTVLNSIIQSGLRDQINYVGLFLAIHSAFQTHKFPAVLTTPSKRRQAGPHKEQSLQGILDKTMQMVDEIYDTFFLEYSYKTERITDESINNFLFQDHQYHSIVNGNKIYSTVITSHKDRINAIRFSDERPRTDEGSIQAMLGKLRGFISYFMGTVRILAINYQQCKIEWRKEDEDEFTIEEAIRTVLSEFRLPDEYLNYLASQILLVSYPNKGEIQPRHTDATFYEKGFRYYAFEDMYNHDTLSELMMYSFQITPEKLLLRVCERAKVMGISATATIPTVIGNYDIAYLEDRLAGKYFKISPDENARLTQTFFKAIKGYDKVNIHAKLIGGEPYSLTTWKAVANHKEMAQRLYDRIEQTCAEETNEYNKERYLRITIAFKEFLRNDRIQSFLCVLTKHPRPDDNALNWDVLLDTFEDLANYYRVPFKVKRNVVQLDGKEYDSKKDDIIRRLGAGERLFVISVYQTIGAGQNLQYPVPAALKQEVVAINDFPGSGKKDFDAIYLDMPTNLLTRLAPRMAKEDLVKYLFQVEMLQESGEVAVKDATTHIKKAFRCLSTSTVSKERVNSINDCRSVIQLSTIMIIQAIGRMCRTNLKAKDLYVYADRRIADRVDFSVCDGRRLNPECKALMDELRTPGNEPDELQVEELELQNQGGLRSVRANQYIMRMLKEPWTAQRIADWKELRLILLKGPTRSKETFDPFGIAYNYFVKMPCDGTRYFYKQQDNYNQVQVLFAAKCGGAEVCEGSCNLSNLMRMPYLKQYFETHGYKTSFELNRYILSPPLFNNIYRGALGEVAGKALFSRYAGVELVDIEDPGQFELFDYVLPKSRIFVDFKNWHESSYKESREEIEHIIDKAKVCGGKCIIVANLFAQEKMVIREQTIDGIKVVIIPALLTDGEEVQIVERAFQTIRRCIRGYSDENQPAENGTEHQDS